MKIASIAEVKAKFSEFIRESKKGPVIVTKNGRPEAALVHLDEDDDLENFMLAHNPKFRNILAEAKQSDDPNQKDQL